MTPVLIFEGFQALKTDWTKTQAKPVKISGIQERIKNGDPDFFFNVTYQYGPGWTHSVEESFPTAFQAQDKTEVLGQDSYEVELWFNTNTPAISTLEGPGPSSFVYLVMTLISVAWLAYFRWLLIKYYQLELAD